MNADSVKENKMSEDEGLPEERGEAGEEEDGDGERYQQEVPVDLGDQLRVEQYKVVLEASRFSEMEYICGLVAADVRMAESVRANLVSLITSASGRAVALSYYNSEEDRKTIIGLESLNEQRFWHTGYKMDKSRKNNFYVGMARYGAEIQTRKGRGAHGSRLLATTIVRQEQGIAPNEGAARSGKRGWFDWILGK